MRQKPAITDGFSLLELLMAMTVAVIIIGLTTLIYRDGDAAWTAGVQRAERDAAARAAIQIIGRDLRHAIADDHFLFGIDSDPNRRSYNFENSEAVFMTLQNDDANSNRTMRAVEYLVEHTTNSGVRFNLIRSIQSLHATNTTNNFYKSFDSVSPSSHASGVIAANVAGFALLAGEGTNAWLTFYTNRLPEYVDIFLELLDERSARRAARMTTNNNEQAEFVERNARRYTTRVYLRNRHMRN